MKLLQAKTEAEKQAKELGHEIGVWKHESFHWRGHYANCTLCGNYVYIGNSKYNPRGTAIEARPVRRNNGITRVKDRCWGVKRRGKKRRAFTVKRISIIKAFEKGGIDAVVQNVLGKYP